ncbi:YebC/PmpR family DNA-binding transcriptional regulator [Mucisphaera calidilacus]|uniref:Probable transcriptional regulatory protein Pan265_28490 n=1 Tax=Mucisphaera calidilacus TaxID=2527982 RepID=A0A518C168_9BACT|nr:YebC/PmpR family DNA-binding transcriptional regulator [Mucisphaera calidilacus]QDU72971.1 putative transcriptional regulatory protein [Mucisphaera calidilacus]
MAGHSKWANIKHRKGRQDARRSKIWSKCSRAIIVAARNGGPDPDANLALRYAIDEAKSENMPKDTIANAIKKGSGNADGENYEAVVYEGYGPNGVAVMLDCLTDNKNRTVPELRKIFEKHGGNLGASGCVAYNFQNKGEIEISSEATSEERLMELALEAGAEDVAEEDGVFRVVTEPSDFIPVRDAIEGAGIAVASAQLSMIPDNTVTCTGRDAEKVLNLVEALEDNDDVQKVYANFDIPEDELASLG